MTIAFSNGNDLILPTVNGELYLGQGGDDTYLITANAEAGTPIVISDTDGANTIQLVDGLVIQSSTIINTGTSIAVELTLSNGAVIQILGADTFTYNIGGNVTTGDPGQDQDFNTFVTGTLETTVPADPSEGEPPTESQGGEVTIGDGEPVGGETFILTDETDVFTGTSFADTFVGSIGASSSTINLEDIINGGGGIDEFAITTSGSGAIPAFISNSVENFFIRATSATTFDMSAISDAEQVWSRLSVADLTLNNLTDLIAIGLQDLDGAAIDYTVNFTASTVAGDADSVEVFLDDVNAGDLTADGVEIFNVNVIGDTASTLDEIISADFSTLNVAGEQAFELTTALDQDVTTVDASANSGGVTLTAGGDNTQAYSITGSSGDDVIEMGDVQAGADESTLNAGSGNDEITLGAGDYTLDLGDGDDSLTVSGAGTLVANLGAGNDSATVNMLSDDDALDGGEGINTINITDAATLTVDSQLLNFQILDIGGSQGGTYDASLIDGLETATVSSTLQADTTIDNLAETTDLTITDNTGSALTANQADADQTVGDALTVNIENGLAADLMIMELTLDDIENITLNSMAADEDDGNIIAQLNAEDSDTGNDDSFGLQVLTVVGTAQLTVNNIAAPDLTEIDASTAEGGFVMDSGGSFAFDGPVEFLGGTGDDQFVGSDQGDTFTGGAGADAFFLGSSDGVRDILIYNDVDPLESALSTPDVVNQFESNFDVFDLTDFGFSGNQQAVIQKGTVTDVDPGDDSNNFFVDSQNRGVAVGNDGSNTFVYVDGNMDGDFSENNDLVIEIAGVVDIAVDNFNF